MKGDNTMKYADDYLKLKKGVMEGLNRNLTLEEVSVLKKISFINDIDTDVLINMFKSFEH